MAELQTKRARQKTKSAEGGGYVQEQAVLSIDLVREAKDGSDNKKDVGVGTAMPADWRGQVEFRLGETKEVGLKDRKRPLKVVVVPPLAEDPARKDAPPGKRTFPPVTVLTPFADYDASQGVTRGLSEEDRKLTFNDVLARDERAQSGSVLAIDALDTEYGGGGYDVYTDIAFVSGRPDSDDPKDRTNQHPLEARIAHEMGHARQAEEGIDESNTSKFVMEYDNIVRYENEWLDRRDAGLRTHYGHLQKPTDRMRELFRIVAGQAGLTGIQLDFAGLLAYTSKADLPGVAPRDGEQLRVLDKALGQGRHAGSRSTIEDNLVGEWAHLWAPLAEAYVRREHTGGKGKEEWSKARDGGMPKVGAPRRKPRPNVTYTTFDSDGQRHDAPFAVEEFITSSFTATMKQLIARELGDEVAARMDAVTYELGPAPNGLEGSAAAAVGNTVYLWLDRPEYWTVSEVEIEVKGEDPETEYRRTLNRNKVMSTFVHETFHAVSWAPRDKVGKLPDAGFQGFEHPEAKGCLLHGTGSSFNVCWSLDEALTDVLAMSVFKDVMGPDAEYETNYLISEDGIPTMWTGQLVDVVTEGGGVDLAELKNAYVDPANAKGLQAKLETHLVGLRAVRDRVVAVQNYDVARVVKTPEAAAQVYRAKNGTDGFAVADLTTCRDGLEESELPAEADRLANAERAAIIAARASWAEKREKLAAEARALERTRTSTTTTTTSLTPPATAPSNSGPATLSSLGAVLSGSTG